VSAIVAAVLARNVWDWVALTFGGFLILTPVLYLALH
jgi:hypothetical protein